MSNHSPSDTSLWVTKLQSWNVILLRLPHSWFYSLRGVIIRQKFFGTILRRSWVSMFGIFQIRACPRSFFGDQDLNLISVRISHYMPKDESSFSLRQIKFLIFSPIVSSGYLLVFNFLHYRVEWRRHNICLDEFWIFSFKFMST